MLFFTAPMTFAQTTPVEYLKNAKDFFDRGQIDSVIFYLEAKESDKLFHQLSTFEQSLWLRLLFSSYISTDQYAKSQEPVKKFLRVNPFYEPNEADPLRLKFAIDSMEAQPTLMFGLKIGTTRTLMKHLGEYRYIFEEGYSDTREKSHFDSYAFTLGLQFEYNINRHLSLNISPSYDRYRYHYKTTFSTKNIDDLGTLVSESSQSLNYLTLPVLLRARLSVKDFKVYGQAGAFTSTLIGAEKKLSVSSSIVSVSNENTMNFHTRNYGLIVGGGIMVRRKRLTLNMDLRFLSGFSNITEKPFYYEMLSLDYYDIPDDLKFRSVELSLGIFYNFKYKVYDKEK
jgi:hypothetical protein